MSEIVLSVENVSKLYRLGEIGTGTISHDLNRWLARIRGKEDPFSQIGAVNDRTQKAESNFAWALKDINFQVRQGDVLGIIGKNGAGKSTLLKLISRITSPTKGEIKIKGRIASLLEVGTGMHPEMTARENIFLNGAIMGMTKKEIKTKFDEILDFAGCTMYVDTPVKRFSSGMRVRLGFAVAAFLEPEILIVDEVLAVGDAEFQKKAIGKMQDVSKSEGRTVLFVSHNMGSVKSLCSSGLVLKNGGIQYLGDIENAVNNYLANYVEEKRVLTWDMKSAPGNHEIKLLSVKVKKLAAVDETVIIEQGDAIELEFCFEKLREGNHQVDVTFHLYDEMNTLVFVGSSSFDENEHKIPKALVRFNCLIPENLMHEGNYTINRLIFIENKGAILYEYGQSLSFEILRKTNYFGWQGTKEGIVRPNLSWDINIDN